MAWTLEHNSVEQSLEAWGLSNCVLSEAGLSTGMLTARIPGDQLAALPWCYLDPVILRLDDVVVWRGWAGMPQHAVARGNEDVAVEFYGPWFWLTQGVYGNAEWDAILEASAPTARASLFALYDSGSGWTGQTVASTLSDIVSACNTWHGGGKLQLGTLPSGFGITPAPMEMTNETYEGCIRKALQLVPDALQTWDYSTTPPTLNFVRRGAATAVSKALSSSPQSRFKPRHDLTVNGVRITYLYKDSNGNPQISVDTAGATSGVGVVEASIEFDNGAIPAQTIPGVSETQVVRSVSTEDALDVSGTHPTPADTWWRKYGGLPVLRDQDIMVAHETPHTGEPEEDDPTLELDADAPENSGASGLDGCTRWLLEGQVPHWLGSASHLRVGILKATIYFRTWQEPPADPDDLPDVEMFADYSGTKGYKVWKVRKELKLPLTDLGSNGGTTYTNVLSTDTTVGGGGAIVFLPTGIAAAMLAAMSTLHYEGTWETIGDECDTAFKVGHVLNVTGGLTAWATMNAQVQQVTHDIDAGRTTVQVGPPEQLEPQDFLAQIRRIAYKAPQWINTAAGGGYVAP